MISLRAELHFKVTYLGGGPDAFLDPLIAVLVSLVDHAQSFDIWQELLQPTTYLSITTLTRVEIVRKKIVVLVTNRVQQAETKLSVRYV